jgi:hypothetical protein
VCLVENTSKGTNRDFVMPRHDDGIGAARQYSGKLYVTPLLADFFKAADSRRRLISRKPSGLSRPNLYLNLTHGWRVSGNWRFEVQFQGLPQVLESFFFGSALAGNVDVQALGNKPVPLAPDSSRKRTLHETILAQSSPKGVIQAG